MNDDIRIIVLGILIVLLGLSLMFFCHKEDAEPAFQNFMSSLVA
jgi:uncharacterized membrane protein